MRILLHTTSSSLELLGYKIINQDSEERIMMASAVNDNFSRDVIIIEPNQLTFANQFVNNESKLVTVMKAIPIDILQSIRYHEDDNTDTEE